jgi:hypothetical protein
VDAATIHRGFLKFMTARIRECPHCKKNFTSRYSTKIFCSAICQSAASKLKFRSLNSFPKLDTGTTGALAELVASVDLMKNGYEVYRAISPSSYSDLLAIKDDEVLKIEVRTGSYYYSANGKKLHFPRHKVNGKIIAIVTHCDGKVHYNREFMFERQQ